MKLEAVVGDRIYATDGRKVFVKSVDDTLEHLSSLPNPKSGLDRIRYNVKTGGIEGRIRRILTGRVHSVNVWPIDANTIFANANRWVFVSHDGGESWEHSLTLRESSGIRGAMPCGLCHRDGTVYLGEYIFDESKNPRVLETCDFGETWDTKVEMEGVRHIHSVQVDPFTDDIWITTGDRDDESIIGILRGNDVEIVGTGNQRWRTVQPIFLPDAILWGTDAPYQENQILHLPRSEIGTSDPDLNILHSETNPFYFGTVVDDYVIFSTSASMRGDSTAPEKIMHESENVAKVWAASKKSGYRDWTLIDQYRHNQPILARVGLHNFTANLYVFLAPYRKTEIIINPFNSTKTGCGMSIINMEELES